MSLFYIFLSAPKAQAHFCRFSFYALGSTSDSANLAVMIQTQANSETCSFQWLTRALYSTFGTDLNTLLIRQSREESRHFERADLLNHQRVSDETMQRLSQYWLESDAIKVLMLISDAKTQCVGFVTAEIRQDIFNNEAVLSGDIQAIYVDSGYRRRGFGKHLMTLAIDMLKDCGAHTANVSWLHSNQASRELYMKMGFTPTFHSGRRRLD